jgi:quercetin dioxygenase-like cupin family protein
LLKRRRRALQERLVRDVYELRISALRASFADGSGAHALAVSAEVEQGAAMVAVRYKAVARGGLITRAATSVKQALESYDRAPVDMLGCVSEILHHSDDLDLSAWSLPPAREGVAYRHRLRQCQLVVVLDGQPSLETEATSRALKAGDVLSFCGGGEGYEVANATSEVVRLLALSRAFGWRLSI